MNKVYSWSISGFYSKADANKVGAELENIDKNNGVTADNVLEYARTHTNSELHSIFDWDDTSAAEKYRRQQANWIISSIKVEIVKANKNERIKPIRAFVQTKKYDDFKPIEVLIQDTDKYQLLLEKAYTELNRVKNKYTELNEIQELLKDIPEY